MAIFTRQSLRLGPKVVPTEPVELDHANLSAPLAAYWLLRDGSGFDYSENGHALSRRGSPAPSVGASQIGPMASFNGSNYFQSSLNPANFSAITLAAWVFVAGSGNGYNLIFGSETANPVYQTSALFASGNSNNYTKLSAAIATSQNNRVLVEASTIGGVSILKKLTFVAATYDGSQVSLYQDGVLIGQAAQYGTIYPTSDPYVIGKSTRFPEAINGLVDNIMIFQGALSGAQIGDLYVKPFAMLRPLVRRTISVPASAVAPGTTRQPVIWFGM